jgi:hypothetical protein
MWQMKTCIVLLPGFQKGRISVLEKNGKTMGNIHPNISDVLVVQLILHHFSLKFMLCHRSKVMWHVIYFNLLGEIWCGTDNFCAHKI